jgi:ketosteroid isomerase-like protein
MTNHETLERFFPAMFGNDREELQGLLADNIVWHVPPFTLDRFGDLVGGAAVIDFLCGAGDEFYRAGSFSLDVEVQAIEEDRGIMMGTMSATTAKDAPYSNRYAFGFRFAEGRIIEVWELLDSVHFERQMGTD